MKHLTNRKQTALLTLGLAFCLGTIIESCGKSGGGSADPSSGSGINAARVTVEIPSSMVENSNQALDLDGDQISPSSNNSLGLLAAPGGVSATSYVIALSGCSSGLSGNNSTAGTIHVYLFDTNCLGKLTSFVLNSVTYLPSGTGAVAFTSWTAGSTAVFAGGGNLVYVQVVSQLSSPIQSADVVSYNFSFINAGTNSSSITVSESQTLYVAGQDAPNFKINAGGATLTNIISSGASQGAGQFTFQLICTTGAMTAGQGADSGFNSYCPDTTAGGLFASGATGVDIGATYFSYKLIVDPMNGGTGGTLTLAQSQAAFAAGGDTTNTLPGAIISGSTGFLTVALTGPVPIASNPKMILILQAKNTNAAFASNTSYSSFQYFPITLPSVNP